MNDLISNLDLGILDAKRKELYARFGVLPKQFVLGGGTAIALQLGHRKSYDFDFFNPDPIKKNLLPSLKRWFPENLFRVVLDTSDELTVIVDSAVKLSFIAFPFPPFHPVLSKGPVSLFDLRDLASAKAYTIGRRGAWRDYVDLFFLIEKAGLPLETIMTETERRFPDGFDSRLFLEQLVYYADIDDFSVDYLGEPIEPSHIRKFFEEAVRRATASSATLP